MNHTICLTYVFSSVGYPGANLRGIYIRFDSLLAAKKLLNINAGPRVVVLTVFWLVLSLRELEACDEALSLD